MRRLKHGDESPVKNISKSPSNIKLEEIKPPNFNACMYGTHHHFLSVAEELK